MGAQKKIPRSSELSFDFAKTDYELVHAEISSIKSKTNMLLGTLGGIGTIGVAILCALRDVYENKKKKETDVENLDNKITALDNYLWLLDPMDNKKVDLKLELGNLDHDSYSKLV